MPAFMPINTSLSNSAKMFLLHAIQLANMQYIVAFEWPKLSYVWALPKYLSHP